MGLIKIIYKDFNWMKKYYNKINNKKIQTALFNSLGNSRLVPEIVIGAGQGEQNNGSEFMRLLAADAALSLKKRLEKEKK